MGENRSRIGAALLGSVAVFAAAGATTAATHAAGWESPYVIGLLTAALLCLIGSLWAFGVLRSPGTRHGRPVQQANQHPLAIGGARSIQRALKVADAAGRLLGHQEPEAHAERGKVLLGEIGAEQITFRVQPWNMMLGMLLRNRTAEVERWAIAAGSTKAVPTAPDGKPTEMDYARLIAYVKEVMGDQ